MVIFQYTHIAVTNGQGMLGANNELVRITWMLEIVHQTTCKHGELVLPFQVFFDVASFQHKVQTLQGV